MKAAALVLLAVGISASAAMAAPPAKAPARLGLDACDLRGLTGHGYTIASGDTCLQITGGIAYWQRWGNAIGGYGAGPGGQVIARTPAGDYAIPMPSK